MLLLLFISPPFLNLIHNPLHLLELPRGPVYSQIS